MGAGHHVCPCILLDDTVRRRAGGGGRVRVHSEIMDVLCDQARFGAAERLDQEWGRLGPQAKVLCTYSSAVLSRSQRASLDGAHRPCGC